MNLLSDNPEVKSKIKEEFVARLVEVSYQKVTVKDLATRLGMSRQNFYRYYASKEEILLDIVDDTFDKVYGILEENINLVESDLDAVAELLKPILFSHKVLIGEVLGRGTDDLVFSHAQKLMRRLFGRIIRERGMKVVDHDFFDIMVSKISASAFYTIQTWSHIEGELDDEKFSILFISILEEIVSHIELACK